MDDSSPQEGGFWSSLVGLFKNKNGHTLEDAIREALRDGELTSEDVPMLLGVLRLQRLYVHELMVPRTDIVCCDVEAGIEEVCRLIVEEGHTRIPIFQGDKDSIIGIIHSKDMLGAMLAPPDARPGVRDIMLPPLFIPENKNVRDMLHEFLKRRQHLAIAVDEYGGTSGLITLEDVIEEIVGDIEDEHDIDEPDEIQALPDGSHLVSGRLELEELNELLNTAFTSEQVETIGGYLCEISGRVPRQGEEFTLEGLHFLVKEADKKQIRWIHVKSDAPSAT
ncbi:putative signal transduction protein with CBS domain containing protein [Desulfovibrio sp. X2]|uniref:hemolysin family protein n=1 Tax=Desulfovibrio sp. X2 TaxID=941449 RepID=UPI000358A1BC|nr:hemolysin family protein [Desulfovibrio sp. X2]EPR42351.1 putative signal transduction protein with CBS domain containing protein [Desulfovibrio sp. X2]